jgi:UDPglucose 6-dehydrogenase
MKVGVIGTGHVGLVTCASLASVGHDVVGNDADPEKIEALMDGRMPFYEPDVEDLIRRMVAEGRLSFSDRGADAVADADVVFICVGTPPRATGEANLAAVEEAARQVARDATGPIVVVEKSTVPAGTAERLRRTLTLERPDLAGSFDVVSNPEFLREGRALQDALEPDRILVGTGSTQALEVMRRLYAPFVERGALMVETDIRTAELAKHACNAFLALKISYANALARLCERTGADVEAVADVMGADARIGRDFLGAGLGYGGYCFPKDLVAFQRLASDHNYDFGLLHEVAKINDEAVEAAVEKIRDAIWNLDGKRIALLGLAFKPGTDDVRFSPSIALARRLIEEGAHVVGCDPHAAGNAKGELAQLEIAEDPYEAATGAHCIVLGTEWPEFLSLDFARLGERVAFHVVVDGRNRLDPGSVVGAGFAYYPMGRPVLHPSGAVDA